MEKIVIIVAGGSGSRMKSEIPKQFLDLNGLPILMHTINAFYNYDKQIKIILVLPKDQIHLWEKLCENHQYTVTHKTVIGGETRFHSVQNAIKLLEEHQS